ncbi:hypothetical protein SDC9_44947 [bioreactor metagenome]|uniref:Pyrroline-5-carboxylate reductase catalytic N-terminal domain-containing protein n=1 Tax=bioreactor metagenome TaxID=1076179 RepID=A0A644W5K4_9ZZZZ
MKIAVIGGTGDMGYGLALRFAKAGNEIIIGSRQREKALAAVAQAQTVVPGGVFAGEDNMTAAHQAELTVISVPSAGHRATLESLREVLKDKLVLDITIPMAFNPLRYAPPAEGSNALETAAVLGENCRVASGFHTVSAVLLSELGNDLHADTLIVANNAELKAQVIDLARSIGLNAYDAGSLALSSTVESLTPMLIGMNKRYGSKHIGIKLTDF